jgi:hypothetical protein
MSTSAQPKGTVPAKSPTHFKQTGALYQRSLAVRNTTEDPHGPAPDAEAQSGKEKTVAHDPVTRRQANREQLAGGKKRRQFETEVPMDPETTVSGREGARREPKAGKPKKGAAGSTAATKKGAKEPKSAEQVRAEEKAKAHEKRLVAARKLSLEEIEKLLPVGAEIQFGATEVRIRAPIAGGAIRYFSGPKVTDAFANMQQEMEEGPASLIPDGGPRETSQFATTESPLLTDTEARARTPKQTPKGGKAKGTNASQLKGKKPARSARGKVKATR